MNGFLLIMVIAWVSPTVWFVEGNCRTCSGSSGPKTGSMIMTEFTGFKYYTLGSVVSNINGSLYTHIQFNEVSPNKGICQINNQWGDLDASFSSTRLGSDSLDPYKGHLNQLRRMKLVYPHLKTIMTVGGFDNSVNFSLIAASSSARVKLAASCASFMQKYGFDGININWQFPTADGKSGNVVSPSDPNNFNLLLAAFRTALPQTASLSASVIFSPSNMNTRYSLSGMAPYVDWINIRSLAFWGGWSSVIGHSANLNPPDSQSPHQRSVTADLSAVDALGISSCKILLSIPSSGYGWILPSTPSFFTYPVLYALGPAMSSMSGADIGLYIDSDIYGSFTSQNGWMSKWDSTAKASMLYRASSRKLITYESATAAALKVQYVADNGYAGVNIEDFHGDENFNILSTAVFQKMQTAIPCVISTTKKPTTKKSTTKKPTTKKPTTKKSTTKKSTTKKPTTKKSTTKKPTTKKSTTKKSTTKKSTTKKSTTKKPTTKKPVQVTSKKTILNNQPTTRGSTINSLQSKGSTTSRKKTTMQPTKKASAPVTSWHSSNSVLTKKLTTRTKTSTRMSTNRNTPETPQTIVASSTPSSLTGSSPVSVSKSVFVSKTTLVNAFTTSVSITNRSVNPSSSGAATTSAIPTTSDVETVIDGWRVSLSLNIDVSEFSSDQTRFEMSFFTSSLSAALQIERDRIANVKLSAQQTLTTDLSFTIVSRSSPSQPEGDQLVLKFNSEMQNSTSALRQGNLLHYALPPPIVVSVTKIKLRRCPSGVVLDLDGQCSNAVPELTSLRAVAMKIVIIVFAGIFLVLLVIYIRYRWAARQNEAPALVVPSMAPASSLNRKSLNYGVSSSRQESYFRPMTM